MDQIKTGKFIKTVRKKKNLTQRDVADRLNISEKTVSKWETGSGLPEVSLMLPLCKLLGISVNELLSGERLDEKSYFEKAEENIVSLATDKTNPKKKVIICTVSCILTLLCAFALGLIAGFINVGLWVRLLLAGIALITIFSDIVLVLLIAVSTEIFGCEKCGQKFVPTLTAYVFGPHTLTRRYLKCPHCGKKSWNKSRIRKQ